MKLPFYLFGINPFIVGKHTFYKPSNLLFEVSDFEGTVTRDDTKLRLERAITDAVGFHFSVPSSRIRFSVNSVEPHSILINLSYTGLVTRNDTYNDVGSLYLDGVQISDFNCSKIKIGAHPLSSETLTLPINSGTHTIDILLPYCTSVDFNGVMLENDVTLQAPLLQRPSVKYVSFGDSITHGFNSTAARKHWNSLLSEQKDWEIFNLGYGGRGIVPSDATVAGNIGADFATYLIGFNNFYPNGQSTTTFKNNMITAISNYRASCTAKGKPNSKLVIITPLWSSSDVGNGGAYEGNSPTLEQFRQATRDAFAEAADGDSILVEGATNGMPTGMTNFPDGVHPNDSCSVLIANKIATVV